MKKYFAYTKSGIIYLFTSFSKAINHAIQTGSLENIDSKDEFYSKVENLFVMKTEEEAKQQGQYEIAG
jgi:hypothetical protein